MDAGHVLAGTATGSFMCIYPLANLRKTHYALLYRPPYLNILSQKVAPPVIYHNQAMFRYAFIQPIIILQTVCGASERHMIIAVICCCSINQTKEAYSVRRVGKTTERILTLVLKELALRSRSPLTSRMGPAPWLVDLHESRYRWSGPLPRKRSRRLHPESQEGARQPGTVPVDPLYTSRSPQSMGPMEYTRRKQRSFLGSRLRPNGFRLRTRIRNPRERPSSSRP
jgi:hypothetical protein